MRPAGASAGPSTSPRVDVRARSFLRPSFYSHQVYCTRLFALPHFGCAVVKLDHAARRIVFAAQVAHADGFARRGGKRRTGDVSDLRPTGAKFRSRCGWLVRRKVQVDALPIHVAARPNPFDDFLSGVAAL